MNKPFKLVFLTSMVILPLLTGCPFDSGALKIALDIEDEGRYDDLFAYFTEQTGYEIEATYGEDIGKLVGTRREPDIIKTSTVLVDLMSDSLLDLTPLINQDPDINPDDYIDSIMEALIIDDKIYALPTSINTSLLYYNRDLFDASADELRLALGLDASVSVYPQADWTYQDYQTAGVVLSKYTISGDRINYSQFGAETQLRWWGEWYVYVTQMGGTFYQPDSNNRITALTSEEVYAATEFFVEKSMGNVNKKFAPDAIEMASSYSFLGGNVAMIFGGHLGDWHSYDAIDVNWDIQVLPTPINKPGALGGEISADAFGISMRSNKVDQAFSFLKMWSGEEGALQMYRYGKIGALKSMETLIEQLPEQYQRDIDISVVFQAIDRALTLPREKYFSKVMRDFVMPELYRLMYSGRGSESDINIVLNRIKTTVDKFYQDMYG
jgi:ABC-type glycerol-3-phosphate transport system substrate-binding protein